MRRTKWKRKIKADVESRRPPKPKHSKPIEGVRRLMALNLENKMEQIEHHPPDIPGFKMSRLKWLLHLILSHKQKKHPGAYSKLNMTYLRNVVPQAGQYMIFLRCQGIIEWVNHSAGRNSRLYRLTEEGRVEFRTVTDQKLIRRIEESRKQIRRRNSKKYPHLNKWIRKVEIDYLEALKTIEAEYENAEDKEAAERRRTYCLAQVERIRAGEIYITVNDTNFRLDSNFTNLPSTLLRHLSIDGQGLIEMDISNSQPFFVISLFDPTPEVAEVINDLDDSILIYIKSLKPYENEDVKRYCSLVTTGKFYRYMAKKFREHGIEYKNRKDVKAKIFGIFFGKRHSYHYNEAADVFRQTFPTVHRLFMKIKEDEKNRLAILLQRMEAHTMLERVAGRIEKELPELPILTRHDSILPLKQHKQRLMTTDTDESNLEKVRKIMVNTIEEVVGVKPQGRMRKL